MPSGTPDLFRVGRWSYVALGQLSSKRLLNECQGRINRDVGSPINTAEENILSWFQLEICAKLVVGSLAVMPHFLKHQLFLGFMQH